MKRLKVLQIGYLHDHAAMTLEAMLAMPECFEVLGLVPFDPGFENHTYEVFDRVPLLTMEQAMTTDIDAAIIETEETSATKAATLFAEKGVAVHLDKPGSPDEAAFTAMIDTFKKTGAPLQMGYMYRFNPAITRVLSDARAGKLGQVYAVEAQMSVRHPDEKREWLSRFKGGMTFFLGCHLIDLVMQFKGVPEKVIPFNHATGIGGCTAEDYGFAVLEYADGASFIKTCATEVNGFERRQLVICAENGTFEIKPLEKQSPTRHYSLLTSRTTKTWQKDVATPWRDFSSTEESEPYDRYQPMMREFYDIVTGKKENPYSLEYELTLFRTILRACGM